MSSLGLTWEAAVPMSAGPIPWYSEPTPRVVIASSSAARVLLERSRASRLEPAAWVFTACRVVI